MSVAAYSRFTEAGIARRAAERRAALLPTPSASEPEIAPVEAPEPIVEPVAKPALTPEVVKSNVIAFSPATVRLMNEYGMPRWARDIAIEVAARYQVPLAAIVGPSRKRTAVVPRNEAFYLIKTTISPTNGDFPSYPQVAKWFGRDHTTVLYGARRHAKLHDLPLTCDYHSKRGQK